MTDERLHEGHVAGAPGAGVARPTPRAGSPGVASGDAEAD